MRSIHGRRLVLAGGGILLVVGLIASYANPQEGENKPEPSLDSTYGSIKLKVDFSPDPFGKMLVAGGPIKTKLGGVEAHVTKAPSFKLYYTAGRFPLTIQVESQGDTTLLINLPDGTWVANHRTGGNPRLQFGKPQSGRYDIWVGTRGKTNSPAVLMITETFRVGDEAYDVYTLKYKTPEAGQAAVGEIRKNFKSQAHVLSSHANFVDVFLNDKRQYPTKDLEWSERVARVSVPGPLPEPLAAARGGVPPEKIIPDERDKVFGKKGKNVILAIIDGGIDFRLQDFWTDGTDSKKESRLLYYWDTTARNRWAGDEGTTKLSATYPDGNPIGHLYSRKNLTDELNRKQEVPVWKGGPTAIKTDEGGHGTGCAAIAAGQGRPNGGVKAGVAPDADLIMVRCNDLYLLNAVCEWLERVAKDEGKPLVISLSQGTAWGGGYDGMRAQDQHLNARFSLEKKGFAACLCAGNEGRGDYNSYVQLDPKGKRESTLRWNSPVGRGIMVFYFDTPDLKDVTITGPQASYLKPFYHKASNTVRTGEFLVPKGAGEVTLTATGNRSVSIDAYILSGHPMNNKGTIKSDRDVEGRIWTKRINSPGTIPNCITVGSYNWAEDYDGAEIGWLSPYSSPGPRRGAVEKNGLNPWLAAPGHKFTVPWPNKNALRNDFNGTSAATPYTAGFVALMFECNKNLTFGQVRELLADPKGLTRNKMTAKDAFGHNLGPSYPNSHWGHGKLDVEAARRILSKAMATK